MRLKFYFAVCALFSVSVLCGMDIVSDGKSSAVIVIPADASEQEISAAQTLSKYIKEISGADLNVVTEDSAPKENAVFIGKVSSLPNDISAKLKIGGNVLVSSPVYESYFMAERNKNIYLAGHRGTGSIFAVYDLLERLGCRWFFGCEAGTVIPKMKTVSVSFKDECKQPSYAHRMHYSWGSRSKETMQSEADWRLANRMSPCEIRGFSGHNFSGIWSKKEYPELFPRSPDGKNVYQVCMSNPKAAEVGLAWALKKVEENPDFAVVSFSPNDGGGGYCQCENCRKIGNVGDCNVNITNIIGREFFKKHPDKMILVWSYAVGAEMLPTLKFDGYDKGEDRVIVNIYSFFNRIPFEELLLAWQKTSHNLAVTHTWHSFHPSYGMIAAPFYKHGLAENYRYLLDNGVTILRTQVPADWAKSGWSRYLSARLMWDVNADTELLKRDFAKSMFPGAPNEAYNLISMHEDYPVKIGIREFYVKAVSLLLRMDKMIKTDDERLRWDFYASFLCLNMLVTENGDVGQKLPAEKVEENYRQYIAFLKGMDKFGALETHQRLSECSKILMKHAGLRGNEAQKMIKDIPAKELDHAKLLSLLAEWEKKYPEPSLIHEFIPF